MGQGYDTHPTEALPFPELHMNQRDQVLHLLPDLFLTQPSTGPQFFLQSTKIMQET